MNNANTNAPATSSESFREEVEENIRRLGEDRELHALSSQWMQRVTGGRYAYNFRWLGRPIIQLPQDVVAMQELIWQVRPDLVVETGIAHGGSLVLSASMLAMLDMCDAIETGVPFDPRAPRRRVIGVDIDIRPHNRAAIEAHPMSSRIRMLQGSSVDPAVIAEVRRLTGDHERVLVCLDSNHTHEHVLAELDAYAPMTTVDSYCVVFDTVIEDLPKSSFPDRPWGPGNSPKSAVAQWLGRHPEFEVDRRMTDKLQLTVAPGGYLRRVRK